MKESMVIYESTYRAVSYLPDKALQLEALCGLLEYGFYDTLPESANPFVNMVFAQAIPCMRNAKERWEISVENGRKGGRPTPISTDSIIRMKQEGMTNKQIADKVGLSEKTIENRITLHNRVHPQNPQNLSVSEYETECECVSEYETGIEYESGTECDSEFVSETECEWEDGDNLPF